MEKKRVLIVEDEIIVSAGITLTLSRKGYECLAVASGEEAIEALHEYEPDIILMDIGLAGMIDGISTAGIIRQQCSKPIVFITEQSNSGVFQQAKGALPQSYINKPYTDAALIQAVELALQQPVPAQAPVANTIMTLGERVSDGIFVFSGNGNEYTKVLFKDILYLEANGMFTIMYCAQDKRYKISLSSNNVVAQLAHPAIVRTSRSFYVNIHRIDSILNDELVLDKKHVPMTKNYKADILGRVTKIAQKQGGGG